MVYDLHWPVVIEGPGPLVIAGVEVAQHHVLQLPVAKGRDTKSVSGQHGELAGRKGTFIANISGLHLCLSEIIIRSS